MITELRYTMLVDGTSDEVLKHHLTWLLRQYIPATPIIPTMAELGRLASPPKKLPEKIIRVLEFYPCDLLFVHRDAEAAPYQKRADEIQRALDAVALPKPPAVCVITVRMQEAWLLFDEDAIRSAAGNPKGRTSLTLPKLTMLENLPDPKGVLHTLLRTASELSGRKLDKFSPHKAAHRVGELIDDFSPLRQLPAFQKLEAQIQTCVQTQQW